MADQEENESEAIAIRCTPQDVEQINNIITDVTARFIDRLPLLVRQKLEDAVAGIMGFRVFQTGRKGQKTEWDLYPFDSKGQAVPLKEMVVEKAKVHVKQAIDKLEFKFTPEMVEALERKFQEEFWHTVNYGIQNIARKKAEEALQKVAAMKGDLEIVPRMVKKDTLGNIANPGYGAKDKIEKALLKDALKVPGKDEIDGGK